jgi:fructose-1,6-bisphosphatase/inositol monophosphatase family enzyme
MEEYLEFAKKLAKEAEIIALKYFSFEVEKTWKEDDTPLTLADTEINDLVIKRINESYPEHSIYGEEKSEIKENSKYIWVCDPIDGTSGFSLGLPIFVFSIALVDQQTGMPILGLINDPVMKNMYWAYKGSGAYRNNQKISVCKNDTLKNSYLSIGASGKKIMFSPVKPFEKLIEKNCKQMKLPSFIYGGVQVANGKFIGSIFYAESGHDIAALKIITEEAGGKVTDLNGKERRYDKDGVGCIISNGILHQEILDIVQSGKK